MGYVNETDTSGLRECKEFNTYFEIGERFKFQGKILIVKRGNIRNCGKCCFRRSECARFEVKPVCMCHARIDRNSVEFHEVDI